MSDRIVTVFGGTGFLGRRIVRRLLARGFSVRIASRHPAKARWLFRFENGCLPVEADIHDERAISQALAGSDAAVNAVSLYVEHGGVTFDSVHVRSAAKLASLARGAQLARFAHVSGIGCDLRSPSRYIRKRAEGEITVRAAFPNATLVRPSVMLGTDDVFLSTMLALVDRFPAVPLFGTGQTRLQPVWVDDVAETIARVIAMDNAPPIVECGGPQTYSLEQLLRIVAKAARRDPLFVPVPFVLWHLVASIAELMPTQPLAQQQVELMQVDNLVSGTVPGLHDLGISPRPLEEVLQEMLWDH